MAAPHGAQRSDAQAAIYHPPLSVVVLFYVLVAAVVLFPIALVTLPPLADLPNHLARIYIINHLADDSDLQKYYTLHWRLLAFQSTDLILPPLARLVGLFLAAKIYIVATLLLLVGGTASLHRALFGRIGLWPGAAALVLYNFMFSWGLISVLFAIGCCLLLTAGWIATQARGGIGRTLVFAVLAVALFICHFFAFAVYAVVIVCFELGKARGSLRQARTIRRLGSCAATLVAPCLLFVFSLDASVKTITQYGSTDDKMRAVLSPFAMYLTRPEFAYAMLLVVALLIARRRLPFAFASEMTWPMLAIAAFTVIMPSELASVWGADFRLPTIALLLAVAASDIRFRNPNQAAVFAAALLAFLVYRIAFVAQDWLGYARDYDELRTASSVIEKGSRLVVLQSSLDDLRADPAPSLIPFRHAAALAVIDRDVFLPHLFASATPLRFAGPGAEMASDQLAVLRKIAWHPRGAAFATASAETIAAADRVGTGIAAFDVFTSTIDWSDWPERFDTLLDLDFGDHRNPVPELLTEIRRGTYFVIYAIHPPRRG
jgi:hypothetical protein